MKENSNMPGVDTPLGVRNDGRPFWPYLGGSEGESEDDGDAGDDGDDGGDGDGDGAARAIAAERAATKRARDAARPWRVLAQELGVKNADEIRALLAAKSKDEGRNDQVDVEAVKRATREEVLSVARRQIVGSAIEALAAVTFADPDDAVRNMDIAEYEVDGDGRVDRNRIKADLADLLRRKPHLAKVSKRVDFEQGPRGKGPSNGADMNTLIRRAAGRA
jgi:hypothetical protein